MSFLKFSDKNLVGLNKKKLKSITYNGKTYSFDLAPGNTVDINIHNNIKETEVSCYKIPKNIIFDVIRIPDEDMFTYLGFAESMLGLLSSGITEIPVYNGINEETNSYETFLVIFSAILNRYLSFKQVDLTIGSITNVQFNKVNEGQNEVIVSYASSLKELLKYIESESQNSDDEEDENELTKYLKAIRFYSIDTSWHFNYVKQNLDETNALIDEINKNVNSFTTLKSFEHITDFKSYENYLNCIKENFNNIFNDPAFIELGDDRVKILTSILKAAYGAIGISNDLVLSGIDTNENETVEEKLENTKKNFILTVESIFGVTLLNLADVSEKLEATCASLQKTEIINYNLLDSKQQTLANYYYPKSFKKIDSLVTNYVSKNLIQSNIFFPQTLNSEEKVQLNKIVINLENFFTIHVSDEEYNYISKYSDLKIARVYFNDELIYREATYDSMKTSFEKDVPSDVNRISITLAEDNDYDSEPKVIVTGPVMFADDDTKHYLPTINSESVQVPDWKGYYKVVVDSTYTDGTYGIKTWNESDDLKGDHSTADQNVYTTVFYNSSLGKDYNLNPEKANCLAGDTMILMADNSEKRLDEIQIGDEVMTLVEGKLVPSKVVYSDSNLTKIGKAVRYYFKNENETTYVDVIKDHRFFTGKRCKHISKMKIGEEVVGVEGKKFKLVKIEPKCLMKHYTIFTENAHPYVANKLITGNIFCNIKPHRISKFLQKIIVNHYIKKEHK